MCRGLKRSLSLGLVFSLGLFLSPPLLRPQGPGKGQLIGFVFGKDGSTPVSGAVVMARNVTTGTVFQSAKTDDLGVFKLENMDAGIYSLGVTSIQGNYNSLDLVGIRASETAKVTIALTPYDREAIEAARAVAREEKERGESLVGKVVTYLPASREATVLIERGLIQVGDQIRVKSRTTDFVQDIRVLKVEGTRARYCLTGQQARLPVAHGCVAGDNVYVVCKRGVPPLFLAPLGLAAIVAGSAALVTIEEEESVSPTKPIKIKD